MDSSGTNTSAATLVMTPTMLILYVASGPNPGMIIYGCSSEQDITKLALPQIF